MDFIISMNVTKLHCYNTPLARSTNFQLTVKFLVVSGTSLHMCSIYQAQYGVHNHA